MKTEKPPLGVMPAWLWREQYPEPSRMSRAERIIALRMAIRRYESAGLVPPLEWAEEIGSHADSLAWSHRREEADELIARLTAGDTGGG